jgi:hypothetical protein
MELKDYPNSFKASPKFEIIQDNPFREIASNIIYTIESYMNNFSKLPKKEISSIDYYSYENDLTEILFDERKHLEDVIKNNGKIAEYIKTIFEKNGDKNHKEFEKFIKFFNSIDSLQKLFGDFANFVSSV